MKFKTGDKVRVKGERGTAAILRFLGDPPGGVELYPPIDGLRYWNVDALVKVKSASDRRSK
jgi:hypothetical protein